MKPVLLFVFLFIITVSFSQRTAPFTNNFDDGTLQGWTSNDPTSSYPVSTSGKAYSSPYSLYYYNFNSNFGYRLKNVQSPGLLSFWVHGGTGADLQVLFDGKKYGDPINVSFDQTWTNYAIEIQSPETGNLDINFLDGSQDLFLDDVSCTRVNKFIPIKPWAIILAIAAIGTFLFISQRKMS